MYIFDFDPETNGIELSWRDTGGEISRREARPVYAGELNILGMDKRWRYDAACPAPCAGLIRQCSGAGAGAPRLILLSGCPKKVYRTAAGVAGIMVRSTRAYRQWLAHWD